jgi:DNA-binding transcriptional MerR regulator
MATEAKAGTLPDGKMTIGELARRTGMTIRNIRAHQTRGLLPPPEVQGRTGYYNEEHVARIELTREMQAEGLNLEAIRRVLESTGGSSKEMVDFARAVRAPFEDETPEIFSPEDFAENWQVKKIDEKLLKRAEKLGALRVLADGNIEVISPRLHRAATRMIEFGISPTAAVAVAAKLHDHADAVARAYVDLFTEQIWEPFDKAGRPDDDWHKVLEALEALRPLASDALLAMFQITMGEETEKAAERTLRNAGKPQRSRSRGRSRKRTR